MERAEAFLQSWMEGNLPHKVDPALQAGKAKNLAHQCRVDAEAVGISNEDLTLAAYGNLVSFFLDEMTRRSTLHQATDAR